MRPFNRVLLHGILLGVVSLACANPGEADEEKGAGQVGGETDADSDADADTDTDTDADSDSDVDCPIATDDFLVQFAPVGADGCGFGEMSGSTYADAECTGEPDGSWMFTMQGLLTPLTCVPTRGDDYTCEGEDDNFRVSSEGFVATNGQRFEGEMSISGLCEGDVAYIAVAD